MCDFCVKHGEGRKWYLQAKNFVNERAGRLWRLSRLAGRAFKFEVRRRYVGWLSRAPRAVRALLRPLAEPLYRRLHFGQVVPIEDVERILDIVGTIVRLPCVCRWVAKGREERVCFGVVVGGPDSPFIRAIDPREWGGPEFGGLEVVDKKEALRLMAEFERRGLVHTIWTFETPLIGSICNCEFGSCLGLNTLRAGIKVMFRGEYVARIDADLCVGCRECERLCPFGAVALDRRTGKCRVNPLLCYGCGICRSVCPTGAISLLDRRSVPVASDLW